MIGSLRPYIFSVACLAVLFLLECNSAQAQTIALTSGVQRPITLGPVTTATLFGSFTINVPLGTGQLQVRLTTPNNANVNLYVRFGQDVGLSVGSPVADYSAIVPG